MRGPLSLFFRQQTSKQYKVELKERITNKKIIQEGQFTIQVTPIPTVKPTWTHAWNRGFSGA